MSFGFRPIHNFYILYLVRLTFKFKEMVKPVKDKTIIVLNGLEHVTAILVKIRFLFCENKSRS